MQLEIKVRTRCQGLRAAEQLSCTSTKLALVLLHADKGGQYSDLASRASRASTGTASCICSPSEPKGCKELAFTMPLSIGWKGVTCAPLHQHDANQRVSATPRANTPRPYAAPHYYPLPIPTTDGKLHCSQLLPRLYLDDLSGHCQIQFHLSTMDEYHEPVSTLGYKTYNPKSHEMRVRSWVRRSPRMCGPGKAFPTASLTELNAPQP